MLLGLRAEAQLVDMVDDLAQVVAALDLVFDLAEDLADFVLDGVRPGGLLLEAVQIGEELRLTKSRRSSPIRALLWSIMPALSLGAAQTFPAIWLVEDKGVFLAFQRGFVGLVLLQAVKIFQEESQEVCSV